MPKSSARKSKMPKSSAKKPTSPFIKFSSIMRPKLQRENSHLKFGDISKLVGSEWRNLDPKEKAEYVTEFREEQKAYQEAEKQRQKTEKKKKKKKKTRDMMHTDNNSNLVDFHGNGYQLPSIEEPTSTLERCLRWMPPGLGAQPGAYGVDPNQQQLYMPYAPGAFGQDLGTDFGAFELSQQYMTYPPPIAPISPPPDAAHPVMINYGAPAPQAMHNYGALAPMPNGSDECVILSESVPTTASNQNDRPAPVPTGIFVSEYYKELTSAPFDVASSESS